MNANDTNFLPDDPRITAYALGELEAGERDAMEAALRADTSLRTTVEAIRLTGLHLRTALSEEAAQALPTETKVVEMFPLQKAPVIQQPDTIQAEVEVETETVASAKTAVTKTQPTGASGLSSDRYARRSRGQVFRFPQIYYILGGVAAACFAVFAIVHPPRSEPAASSTKVLVDMSTLVPTRPISANATTTGTLSMPSVTASGMTSASVSAKGAGETAGAGTPSEAAALANLNWATKKTAPETPRTVDTNATRVAATHGENKTVIDTTSLTKSELPTLTVVTPPEARIVRTRELPATTAGATANTNAAASSVAIVASTSAASTAATPAAFESTIAESKGAAQSLAPSLALSETNDFSGAPSVASGQVASGGDKLYIPGFKMSADRLRNRAAAQATADASERNSASGPGAGAGGTATDAAGTADGIVKLDTMIVTERDGLPAPGLLSGEVPRAAFKGSPRTFLPESKFVKSKEHPYSAFLAEHDTASYFTIRQAVQARHRPSPDSVRIEELLNYFPYHYAAPSPKGDAPIAATLEVADAPWAPEHRLVRIGLKAREVTTAERPAANLVFLIENSATMNAGRLPLVKESLRLLLGKLRADDRVAIVTYGTNPGLVLPSTSVSRASEILRSLDRLRPSRPSNGLVGLRLAYDVARANLVNDGINRVILCTGGDLNIGVVGDRELTRLVEEKAEAGMLLSVLGFGMGDLRDRRIERLADTGNGMHGYIDSRKEAEKLLVQQVNGTLVMIAKDVKIQVDFNPSQVASYRLIGYENRALPGEEIANNKVDAGEIGAGHTITALYEVIPANLSNNVAKAGGKAKVEVEDRRYNFYSSVSDNAPKPDDPRARELMMVRVSYKKPGGFFPRQLDFPLADAGGQFASASPDFKFAAAIAGYGMILRDSPYKGTATMADVIEWAQSGVDDDVGGYRSDFIELARITDGPEK